MKEYFKALLDPKLAPTALKVSLVVGSALFIINHGTALFQGQMTRQRWLSSWITYFVPYCVNIHGQYINRRRRKSDRY